MEEQTLLEIQDYSEKSFVIFGDTKPFKESFKAMGGKFNKYLKYGEEKAPGWIFPKKFQEEVTTFVERVNSGETPEVELPSVTDDLPTVSKPKNATSYQWVKFRIFRPRETQTAVLTTEDGKNRSKIDGKVIKVESHNDVVDTVYIQFEGQDSPSMGVISRGKWQLFGYFKNHTIYFSD